MKSPSIVFSMSEKCIMFYEKIFKKKYPFTKLDHVACPNVRYGGMESAGCIVYSENFLALKQDQQIKLSTYAENYSILFHEISHQWFGNLVTM